MGVPGDKMNVGDSANANVSGPTPKPVEEIKCNNCGVVLPPLDPSETKCPTGYLCKTCAGTDRAGDGAGLPKISPELTCSKYAFGTEHGMVDVSIPKAFEEKFQAKHHWELHHAIEALINGGPYVF